jgi:Trehalase
MHTDKKIRTQMTQMTQNCADQIWILMIIMLMTCNAWAQVLDKQKVLERQTWWDNRDWDWYKENIPFFECPDPEIEKTYYYRWEVVTKHLTYGSPNSGYSFTEFIDRPFWSGAYGAISCPAGHQLYEVRWMRDPRYARDYSRYWFRTPGAQPRRYSTWLADSVWAVHAVHPANDFIDLLPDLIENYQGWEKSHFVPEVGLFWQTGHDDGMEININSRQTADTVRGAPGFRPTMNSYMYADALAISKLAVLVGDVETAAEYRDKAKSLKEKMQTLCWDEKRKFFMHVYQRDEEREGHRIKALSKTYETGKFAGSPHGREQIGFVPWQFNIPDSGAGYEAAWKTLMDPKYFYATYGPTTVERDDPLFSLSTWCCWWSGQSWPFATTQTLKGMANLLQNYQQDAVTREDYVKLLSVYARTHRKKGVPYIAEACHPDTGSWEGHDSYNHSEHYFHSGFNDLVITGLVGVNTSADDKIVIDPLAPAAWDYFAVDDLVCRGKRISILWDKTGERYGRGKGLLLLADGKVVAQRNDLGKLAADVRRVPVFIDDSQRDVNYAVNNDGWYFPRVSASFSGAGTDLAKVNDGNYWYHISPPNRCTFEGSENARDWLAVDFGVKRKVGVVKIYFLEDETKISPPQSVELEYWDGDGWKRIKTIEKPEGRKATVVSFAAVEMQKLRAGFVHRGSMRTGITELEAWGRADGKVDVAPPPPGNLAMGAKVSASFTSRFDDVKQINDGQMNFSASPHNRWTAYESPNASDWIEVDFGGLKQVRRVELAIYDDRGGVKAPESYNVQVWDGSAWKDAAAQVRSPKKPVGGRFNEVIFEKVGTSKLRVIFTHAGKARSGISEIMIWPE